MTTIYPTPIEDEEAPPILSPVPAERSEQSQSKTGKSMASGMQSTVALSTAVHDAGLQDATYDDGSPTSPVRLRYVSKVALVVLEEKLRRGQEVVHDDLVRIAAPDRLSDTELLVPVHLDATWVGGVQAAVQRHGGPKGAAVSLLAARGRCEVANGPVPITAKEWRALARESDGVLKPLLLAFVTFTALGSGVLLTAARDGSHRFLLLLLVPHVGPEVLLVTYLLFGPQPNGEDSRWKPRIAMRMVYLVCVLLVASMPLRSDGLAGPVPVAAHVATAALSDGLCLWLGALLCLRRPDAAGRRVGAALFAHGLSGQVAAAEFMRPHMFSDIEGAEALKGWGWVLTALGTALSLLLLVPVFPIRHIDLRAHHPTPQAAGAVCALAVATVLLQPLLAWKLPDVRRQPSFLPRGDLLALYKMASSLGGMVLALYAANQYNVARQRPLPPALATFVGSAIWRSLQWVD